MSHATVMVKVTAKRLAAHGGNLGEALDEMMAPYNEQTEDPRFRVFHDEEPGWREEYKTGTRRMLRTPSGDLVSPYEDRFRTSGFFNPAGQFFVPSDHEEVEVPFRELYADFETYVREWHSSEPDEKTGKYGHWHNPNATWDWYQIGGRWRGFFPLRPGINPIVGEAGAFDNKAEPGHGDVVHLADIDMDAVARVTRERAEKFWTDWQAWLARTYVAHDPFSGPRSRALAIGLLDVVQGPALSDHMQKAIPWAGTVREDDPRKDWHDVAKIIDRDKFMAEYIDCFCPIKAFAALDNDGWHAPGRMGWFGCNDSTPDSYAKFAREFVGRFVKNAAADDLLVVVDYHI